MSIHVSSSTRSKDTQHGWSVKINKVKPLLNMTFERTRSRAYEDSGACVKFSSTGEYLAAGVNNKGGGWSVRVYDMKTGKKKSILVDRSATNSNSRLWSICFSPGNRYLAVADSAKKIWIWEIKKNLIRTIFKGHTKRVTSVDFSPDGRFLASCSTDRTVRIWSMRDGFSKVLEDNAQSYFQVRFSPNGSYIAAANDDGMLRIWNARTGRLVSRRRGDEPRVVFTPDGKQLLSVTRDGKMLYRNISSLERGVFEMQSDKNKETLKLMNQVDLGICLDISPNGQWVVTSSHDKARICEFKGFEWQCTLQKHGKQILSADFSPAGGYLALGLADGEFVVWRYAATSSVA